MSHINSMTRIRRFFQFFFLALAVTLTVRNLLGFTKANLESWCPGGGLESIWFWFKTGAFLCATSGINFIMFLAVLFGTVIAGRSFCSWVCPIGTIMEALREAGMAIGAALTGVWRGKGRHFGLLRYISLLVILYFTTQITDLVFRPFCPYYVMLSGQEHEMAWWSKWLMLMLVGVSIVLPFIFCRCICPLGAVLGLARKLSPLAPSIDLKRCTSCRSCSAVCPQQIDVLSEGRVTSSDCTQCLSCVSACPENCLHLGIGYTGKTSAISALSPAPGGIVGCTPLPKGCVHPYEENDVSTPRIAPRALLPTLVAATMLIGIASALWYPIPTVVHTFASPSSAGGTIRQADLIVQGLRCRGTSMTLIQLLTGPAGLIKLETYVGENRLRLWYDPDKISLDTVKYRIDAGLLLINEKTGEQQESKPFRVEKVSTAPFS
ncbi:MAG: 4Fe-4S binding protein [Candidatus Ozemobacteraceae bacterium]